jgi:small subunit ribosomal protein S17
MTGATTRVQGKRKVKTGRVVSDRMDKTIVVSVERLARHRLYKRVIRLTTKFKAHDENNDARIGDTVLIEEARPLSATKRWRLVEVVQRAGDHGLPGEAVVAEEEATTEAIHAAAHPGRVRAAEAAEAAESAADATEAGETATAAGEATAEAPASESPAAEALAESAERQADEGATGTEEAGS